MMLSIVANIPPDAILGLAILACVLLVCGMFLLVVSGAEDSVGAILVGALFVLGACLCLMLGGQGRGEENRTLPDFEEHCRGAITLSVDPSNPRKEDLEQVQDELRGTMNCEMKIETIESAPFPNSQPPDSATPDTSGNTRP